MAEKLLLVDFFHCVHSLLVCDVRLAASFVGRDGDCANISLSRECWVAVLEPLDLLSAEQLPDRVPLGVMSFAHLGELIFTGVRLRCQASALSGCHVGEPTLELLLEGGGVGEVVRVVPEILPPSYQSLSRRRCRVPEKHAARLPLWARPAQ